MASIAELSQLLKHAEIIGDPCVEVSGLSCDSRQVKPGDLFVCVTGFQSDGHAFAADAVAKGAKALVVEHIPESVANSGITFIKTNKARRALAILAAHYCHKGYHRRDPKLWREKILP